MLLTSLLRNFSNAYTVLGSYGGYGHAWVSTGDGQVLETTYDRAAPVADLGSYRAYGFFNDREVVELWPGALDQVFEFDAGVDPGMFLRLFGVDLNPQTGHGLAHAVLQDVDHVHGRAAGGPQQQEAHRRHAGVPAQAGRTVDDDAVARRFSHELQSVYPGDLCVAHSPLLSDGGCGDGPGRAREQERLQPLPTAWPASMARAPPLPGDNRR